MSQDIEPTPPDKADFGCLMFIIAFFALLPFIITGFFMGGAIFMMPIATAVLMAIAVPWINPAEKMAPQARWIGRALTWLLLVSLVVGGYLWWKHSGDAMPSEDGEVYEDRY